jgi:hypothetical protein
MVIFLWLHKNKILKEDPAPWPFQRNGIYSVYIVSSKGRLEEQSSRMHRRTVPPVLFGLFGIFRGKFLRK